MRAACYTVGLALVALAWVLTWEFYTRAKEHREQARVEAVFRDLTGRLETHRQTAGHFPDSLAALSITKPAEVQFSTTLSNVTYQRMPSGYTLSYTGPSGYHKSYAYSDERKLH